LSYIFGTSGGGRLHFHQFCKIVYGNDKVSVSVSIGFFKYYKVIRDLNKGSGTNKGVFGFDFFLKASNFLANWAAQQEVLEVISDSSSGPFFFGPFGAKFDHKLSVAVV
jgi:hypothetical protein